MRLVHFQMIRPAFLFSNVLSNQMRLIPKKINLGITNVALPGPVRRTPNYLSSRIKYRRISAVCNLSKQTIAIEQAEITEPQFCKFKSKYKKMITKINLLMVLTSFKQAYQNRKKYCLAFILTVTLSSAVYSQTTDIAHSSYDVQKIPAVPEMSNLGKFGQNPMNKYNGTANINIPLYSIPFQDLNIPLSLNYNTGGIKVEEEASWVGLGWNLSEGISITREVNGYADNRDVTTFQNESQGWIYSTEYLKPAPPYDFKIPVDTLSKLDQLQRSGNPVDTQPDLFTVTLPSGSFKFYLPKIENNETLLYGKVVGSTNYKVMFNVSNADITIVDQNGYQYFFNLKESSTGYSSEGNYISDQEALNNISYSHRRQTKELIHSWKASRIISSLKDTLKLHYSQKYHLSFPHFTERHEIDVNGGFDSHNYTITTPTSTDASLSVYKSLQIDSITGRFGMVEFNKDFSRKDLFSIDALLRHTNISAWGPTVPQGSLSAPKGLTSVRIKDTHRRLINHISIYQSYFNENYLNEIDKETYLRSKLDSLIVNGQKYSFNYFGINSLPPKNSRSLDFWGFYNGKSNSNKIPSFNRFYYNMETAQGPSHERFFHISSANRSADYNYGKFGTLSSIIYPTGGRTDYIYEGNKVSLQEVYYDRNDYSDGTFRSSGLRSSKEYNFNYQFLKLAKDPSYTLYNNNGCQIDSYSNSTNNSTIVINDTEFCKYQDYNIKISVQIHCNTNCGNGDPSGSATWIENVTTGDVIELADFSIYSSLNNPGHQPVTKTYELLLPIGSYKFHYNPSMVVSNTSGDVIYTNNSSYTVWEDNSVIETGYETFEVGGLRVKETISKDLDNRTIDHKMFVYDSILPNNIIGSSGILMDDLIFQSKGNNLYEYTPEIYAAGNKFYLSSENKIRTHNAAQGSHIGYSSVKEIKLDSSGDNNGIIVSKFLNYPNDYFTRDIMISKIFTGTGTTDGNAGGNYQYVYDHDQYTYEEVAYGEVYVLGIKPNTFDYINGSLSKEIIYDNNENEIKNTWNSYSVKETGSIPVTKDFAILQWSGYGFPLTKPYLQIDKSSLNTNKYATLNRIITTHNYQVQGSIQKVIDTTTFVFSSKHGNLVKKTDITSEGNLLTKMAYYPQDLSEYVMSDSLISINRYNELLKTEYFLEKRFSNKLDTLSTQIVEYSSLHNASQNILPSEVKTLKGNRSNSGGNNDQVQLIYDRYDDFGNLLQFHKPNGEYICYIYGYNHLYPVAKLTNVTYDSIDPVIIAAIQLDSDMDTDRTFGSSGFEGALRTRLNQLRESFPQAQIETYTYDPLIGITSKTDQRGITIYYDYDENHRLKEIRDGDHNILSDYKYNYANTP